MLPKREGSLLKAARDPLQCVVENDSKGLDAQLNVPHRDGLNYDQDDDSYSFHKSQSMFRDFDYLESSSIAEENYVPLDRPLTNNDVVPSSKHPPTEIAHENVSRCQPLSPDTVTHINIATATTMPPMTIAVSLSTPSPGYKATHVDTSSLSSSLASASPLVPDNTSAASPSGTIAGATPILQASTSFIMTASTSASTATSASHQTGTKRKRAKKLQGLTDEEAEEKRLRTNMLEKERMNRQGAEIKTLQGFLPDEFVDDEKTTSLYNTLKLSARYIWLLNTCHTKGTSKDGAAFKHGLQAIVEAQNSRWQTDVIDTSIFSSLFENKKGSFFPVLKEDKCLYNVSDLMMQCGQKYSMPLLNAFHMEAVSSKHQQFFPSTPHPSNSHYTASFAITEPTPPPQIHFQQLMNPSSAMAVRGPMPLNTSLLVINDVSGLHKFQPSGTQTPSQMWANQTMSRPSMIQTAMRSPTPASASVTRSPPWEQVYQQQHAVLQDPNPKQPVTYISGYMGHVSQQKAPNTCRSGMQAFATSTPTASKQQNFQTQMLPHQFQCSFISQANPQHASSAVATAQHPGIASCSYPLNHNPVDAMYFSPSTSLNASGIPSSQFNMARSVHVQNFGFAGYHEPNHNQFHEPNHNQFHEPNHNQFHEPHHNQFHEPHHNQFHEPNHNQFHEPHHNQFHEPNHNQFHEPNHNQFHEPNHNQFHEPNHNQFHESHHNQFVNVQRTPPTTRLLFNPQEDSGLGSELDTPNGTPTMSPRQPHMRF